MESLRQDVQLAVRMLLKQPGFSLLAIATLALGIGLSTALFSILDAAFVRPLPYYDSAQLVDIHVEMQQKGREPGLLSPAWQDTEDWRAHGQVFSHIAVSRNAFFDPLILTGGEPMRILAERVSRDYFPMYGVSPMLGRNFTDDEYARSAADVAILGFDFWQSRFAGDREVVGTVIRLNEEPVEIVGVLPAWFYTKTELWRPFDLARDSFAQAPGSGASVAGRLRPGLSLAEAEAALDTVSARAAESRGGTYMPVQLTSMYESATRSNVRTARVIGYGVGMVLLLACVNVAGLLLARGAVRKPELAVRMSLGAPRGRLVRQLLTESLVLSLGGATVGVLVAWIALDTLVANIPMALPDNAPVVINLTVLALAVFTALATGVLFGLIPAWRLSRVSAGDALARAGRSQTSAMSNRTAHTLIAVEVALAMVLLAGAGVMVLSFTRLMAVDLGFRPDAVLAMEVSPATPGRAAQAEYYPALLERLRQHPGVAFAGAVDYPPLIGGSRYWGASVPGGASAGVGVRQYIGDFFPVLGPELIDGRLPTEADYRRAGGLAVLNQSAKKALFGEEAAVGRRISIGDNLSFEVAAVIEDIRHAGPLRESRAEVWYPFDRADDYGDALVVMVRPDPAKPIGPGDLRQAAHAIGSGAVVDKVARGSAWLADRVVTPRRRTVLLSLLGGLGFLLALVGVFGMTAYAVARRTQEIGVRMAFGATPADVVTETVRDAVWPVAIGVAGGFIGSWWATRIIASFLYETQPRDISTFGSVALVLAAAAAIAAWIPARRAARVDPIVALRE